MREAPSLSTVVLLYFNRERSVYERHTGARTVDPSVLAFCSLGPVLFAKLRPLFPSPPSLFHTQSWRVINAAVLPTV